MRASLLAAICTTAAAALAEHRPAAPAAAPGDPGSLVAGVSAWAAWALALYLLVGVGLTALGHLRRGRATGRGPRPRGWTPALVRRGVEVAVGATATTAVVALAPVAASADTGPVPTAAAAHPRPVAAAPLDWPGLRDRATSDAEVVVRRGDTLWSISARRLGPGTSPAHIAAAWPRLYAANRGVIGTDPNLIRPGQRLTVPPTTGGAR